MFIWGCVPVLSVQFLLSSLSTYLFTRTSSIPIISYPSIPLTLYSPHPVPGMTKTPLLCSAHLPSFFFHSVTCGPQQDWHDSLSTGSRLWDLRPYATRGKGRGEGWEEQPCYEEEMRHGKKRGKRVEKLIQRWDDDDERVRTNWGAREKSKEWKQKDGKVWGRRAICEQDE